MEFNEFKALFVEWKHRNAALSFENGKHTNCRKILFAKNKEDIIGFTCLMLDGSGSQQAFYLLYELVEKEKQPPIDDYYRGRVPVILECWRYWALKNRYVDVKFYSEKYWVEDKYGNIGNWH